MEKEQPPLPVPDDSTAHPGQSDLDWSDLPGSDKAMFARVKQEVKDADPKTLTPARKFARTTAKREEKAAQQLVKTGKAAASQKPRGPRGMNLADPVQLQANGEDKPKRTRKAAAKAADQPAAAAPGPVEPTPENVAFLQQHLAQAGLATPPTTTTLLEATPERLAFTQQHFARIGLLDAPSAPNQARPTGPGVRQATDASKQKPGKKAPAASSKAPPEPAAPSPATSYGTPFVVPQAALIQAEAPGENVIERGPARVADAEQDQAMHDAKLFQSIAGNASILMSAPRGEELSRGEGLGFATDDLEALGGIKSEATRKLALAAIAKSRAGHQFYKSAFDRLAPHLAADLSASEHSMARKVGTKLMAMVAGAFGQSGGKSSAGAAAPVAPAADKSTTHIPDAISKRYLKDGNDYYFPDKSHAFVDRGTKLATRGEHPEVIKSLVEIAKGRGWESVTLKGTKEFRRTGWMEATQAGLKVAGYEPSALDLAALNQQPPTNSIERGIKQERTVPAPGAAEPAKTLDKSLLDKATAFEQNKPGFVVAKYPDLAPSYGLIDAARKFAAEKIPGQEEQFAALARKYVMQQIMSGEQTKGPKINLVPAKDKEVELGKSQPKPGKEVGERVR